ncbi:MAG: Met-10+ like-protein-domain-containing protein [Monoraphidium minutum]|nr:MAG: Met-10+ like-protein-domain-containing protein [Monoraphidium minutum]
MAAAAGGEAARAAAAAPALDKSAFRRTVTVPALRIPKQRCNELMRTFRGFTLDRPKTRCIVPDGADPDTRLLLLREDLPSPEAAAAALPPKLQAVISDLGLSWSTFELEFDYRHLTAEQVLRQLLPAGMEVPSSFESIGHIAHLNLKEEALPYKSLIGQVLVDKNPHITTVVNKLGTIENEYRVFDMEVLAGDPSFETEVVQHGLRFRLDFSKVYWNSRLETEHHRLVQLFDPRDVIADVMAGIGPFAVPAGLRGCTVYANDLNPDSARYLATNVRINRLSGRVVPFRMDGRAFIRLLLATPGGPADGLHAVMNLPASAVEFLDAFSGAFDPDTWRGRLPTLHVYTFMKGEGEEGEAAARARCAPRGQRRKGRAPLGRTRPAGALSAASAAGLA